MAEENTRSADKGATERTEQPTKEQVDFLFASIIDSVDAETDTPAADLVTPLIATQWRTARELIESDVLKTRDVDVDEIAEEWL